MEKYSSKLLEGAARPETWPAACVQTNTKPWFRTATHLGSGENSDVFALGHRDRDSWRSDDSDDDDDEHSSDECSDTSCSQCGGPSGGDDTGTGGDTGTGDGDDTGGDTGTGDGDTGTGDGDDTGDGEGDGDGDGDGDHHHRRTRSKVTTTTMTDLEQVRIYRKLALGKTQLVAKVFEHLDEDTCFGVWVTDIDEAVVVLHDEIEAEDFVRNMTPAPATPPEVREMPPVYARGDAVGLTAFDNEAIVHLLLSDLAAEYTPHITQATDALRWRNTGYLIMERIACTLEDLLFKVCGNATSGLRRDFTDAASVDRVDKDAVVNIVFQALFALAFMQGACKLKHHDLHTNNVFVKEITADTEFRGSALKDAAWFHYHLNGQDFFLPNCGFLAKIGDFGMASLDVHGKRIGRADITLFNDNPQKWGAWSTELDGNEGYDTQLLFADTCSTCKSAFGEFKARVRRRRRNRGADTDDDDDDDARARASSIEHDKDALLTFFGLVRTLSGSERRNVTRHKKRPLVDKVSRKPAAQLLAEIFGSSAGAGSAWWHGFVRTSRPTDGSTIVTLGSSAWLINASSRPSSSSSSTSRSRRRRRTNAAAAAAANANA